MWNGSDKLAFAEHVLTSLIDRDSNYVRSMNRDTLLTAIYEEICNFTSEPSVVEAMILVENTLR